MVLDLLEITDKLRVNNTVQSDRVGFGGTVAVKHL